MRSRTALINRARGTDQVLWGAVAFSWKAIALKTPVVGSMSEMAMFQQLPKKPSPKRGFDEGLQE